LFEALIRRFESLEDVFRAEIAELLDIEGVSEQAAEVLAEAPGRLPEAETFVKSISEREIGLCTRFDKEYSNLLLELHDPPPLLYVRGKLPDHHRKTVCLVGARNATSDGQKLTSVLAKAFAGAGVQIVSSLDGGAAAVAHLACKTAGGVSFAITNAGFDQCLNPEIMPLAIDIAGTGGIISEYSPEATITEQTESQTSRLLAGLCHGVVITEAYSDSTEMLDLMKACAEVGKLVFFVVDPDVGALADEKSLAHALSNGAVLLEGLDKVNDIVKSLV